MTEQYEYRIFSFYMGSPDSEKNSESLINRYGEDGWIFSPIEQTYFTDGSRNDLIMLGRRVKQQPAKKIYDKI